MLPSGVSTAGMKGHAPPPENLGLLPGSPRFYIHKSYNVPYITGVVAPQAVQINYRYIKTAPYIHLESLPHIYVGPQIAPIFRALETPLMLPSFALERNC